MDAAVFLRGINTGNRQLKTAEFAREFPVCRLENIGAAGTFVARDLPSLRALRESIQQRLPFATEVMIAPAREVTELVESNPFRRVRPVEGARRAVSVVLSAVPSNVRVPLARPDEANWEVRVIQARGMFVVSVSRRLSDKRVLYPNEVVEREFGVRATTRWWETLEQVDRLLRVERIRSPDQGHEPQRSRDRAR